MPDEDRSCLTHLRTLKSKGQKYGAFGEIHTMLQEESASKGLGDKEIKLLVDILINGDLSGPKKILLIKCMTPMYKMPKEPAKSLITWCLAYYEDNPITVSSLIVQWTIGLYEYQLVDRDMISMFYDVFFHVMLKKKSLERHIAYLIYVLSKPENVTRRAVSRLLAQKQIHAKPPKHIIALLSLFKSYKPELVPEKIPSMNVESAWKPIPEVLRLQFKEAKDRAEIGGMYERGRDIFNWNSFEASRSRSRKSQSLLPSVGYCQIGSNIFKDPDRKSIFEVSNVEELGKYQRNVELPCNAVSLLSNMAGHHLLTYADIQYQSRFVYNLHNTLTRGFILENGKFSPIEMEKLLGMTVEFSRYIQQGLLVVNLFFDEYMSLRTGEYEEKLLSLLEWMVSLSVDDLREKVVPHIQSLFSTSDLKMKCVIIKTLRKLITNLFVHQQFAKSDENIPSRFLGQAPNDSFDEVYQLLVHFASNLIITGLNIHAYDRLLLSEALFFYQKISILEERSGEQFFSFAPPPVVYGSIVCRSTAIVSQVCRLLNGYRDRGLELKRSTQKQMVDEELSVYAKDIITTLWYSKPFSKHEGASFLRTLPKRIINDLSDCHLGEMLNLSNHYAFLPFLVTLGNTGLQLSNLNDCLSVATCYYPAVSGFLSSYLNLAEPDDQEIQEDPLSSSAY